MNRRQFIGASLAGVIASLMLPFERFAEWCGEWLSKPNASWQLTVGDYAASYQIGEKVALCFGSGPTGHAIIAAIDRGVLTLEPC